MNKFEEIISLADELSKKVEDLRKDNNTLMNTFGYMVYDLGSRMRTSQVIYQFKRKLKWITNKYPNVRIDRSSYCISIYVHADSTLKTDNLLIVREIIAFLNPYKKNGTFDTSSDHVSTWLTITYKEKTFFVTIYQYDIAECDLVISKRFTEIAELSGICKDAYESMLNRKEELNVQEII